jgi:hypothetical protein
MEGPAYDHCKIHAACGDREIEVKPCKTKTLKEIVNVLPYDDAKFSQFTCKYPHNITVKL